MTAQTADLKLDGNALGGVLLGLFGTEMTPAIATCGSCGARGAVATLDVYVRCPGIVARCPSCDSVLLRIVESPDRTWVSLDGIATLELRSA